MSAGVRVAVVATGTANIASVLTGLRRAGAEPFVTVSPDDVRGAAAVVLPGVGAFGAAIESIDGAGLRGVLVERIGGGRPTLCICLGLQLLAETSQESPGVRGLGVVAGEVTRFAGEVRVPHVGWNTVEPDGPESRVLLVSRGYAYYSNSYRLAQAPAGWVASWSEHGGRFIASLQRGAALACQFHPELSGEWGQDLLRRWLAQAVPHRDNAAKQEAAPC